MQRKLNKADLVNQIRNIGVKAGDLLHLKVSMRSIGEIDGGAETLLDALLEVVGDKGTLVSDAFIHVYPLPLDDTQAQQIADDNTRSYAGAFANAMINHPDMLRSSHPIQKFAAIGHHAKALCGNHTEQSGGYDLLNEMAKMNAVNLTIGKRVVGVGTTHVAIELVGLRRRHLNMGINYRNAQGEVKLAKVDWNGGCAYGFPKFIPFYEQDGAVLGLGKIGEANALLTSMKETLRIEMEILKENPAFFFCDDKTCYSCQMAWEHSPKKAIPFYTRWLWKNLKGLSFSRIRHLSKALKKS
ncbi:MAG: AAC(3) family N-acetyltransferase [Bacteroidota bacterium]|nr:AAC(3) family N-acetyltransferase [Bacteroidota bacterium]